MPNVKDRYDLPDNYIDRFRPSGATYEVFQKSMVPSSSIHFDWNGRYASGEKALPGDYKVCFYLDGRLAKELPLAVVKVPSFAVSGHDGQIINTTTKELRYTISCAEEIQFGVFLADATSDSKDPKTCRKIGVGTVGASGKVDYTIKEKDLGPGLKDGKYHIVFWYLPSNRLCWLSRGKIVVKEFWIDRTTLSLSSVENSAIGLNPKNSEYHQINARFSSNEGVVVDAAILDNQNQVIVSLKNGEYVDSGDIVLAWKGYSDTGSLAPDGLYRFNIKIRSGNDACVELNSPPFPLDTTPPAVIYGPGTKSVYYISPDRNLSI